MNRWAIFTSSAPRTTIAVLWAKQIRSEKRSSTRIEALTPPKGIHIIGPIMDEQNLQRIKNTAVKILIARECPDEVGLLMASVRLEWRDVENNNYHDDNSLWALNIFLPAEHYARMDRDALANSAEIIGTTINEITEPHRDKFVSVRFGPEWVDKLSFDQEKVIEWLAERFRKDDRQLASSAS